MSASVSDELVLVPQQNMHITCAGNCDASACLSVSYFCVCMALHNCYFCVCMALHNCMCDIADRVIHIHAYIYTYIYVHTHIYMSICMYMCVYVCSQVFKIIMHICVCIYIYMRSLKVWHLRMSLSRISLDQFISLVSMHGVLRALPLESAEIDFGVCRHTSRSGRVCTCV